VTNLQYRLTLAGANRCNLPDKIGNGKSRGLPCTNVVEQPCHHHLKWTGLTLLVAQSLSRNLAHGIRIAWGKGLPFTNGLRINRDYAMSITRPYKQETPKEAAFC